MDNKVLLECLYTCGLDNWEGYNEALDMYIRIKRDEDRLNKSKGGMKDGDE